MAATMRWIWDGLAYQGRGGGALEFRRCMLTKFLNWAAWVRLAGTDGIEAIMRWISDGLARHNPRRLLTRGLMVRDTGIIS